jgi:hypothetical protein
MQRPLVWQFHKHGECVINGLLLMFLLIATVYIYSSLTHGGKNLIPGNDIISGFNRNLNPDLPLLLPLHQSNLHPHIQFGILAISALLTPF